jgi:endonuclease III
MQFLCKRKISLHSSTPMHEYPSVRLPRDFKALIGKTASIYLAEDIDKLTFNVIIDKKVDKVCANSERSHDENRLAAVESQIAELKSLLLLNESASFHNNENRWARRNSNPRSPPCEGDVITN